MSTQNVLNYVIAALLLNSLASGHAEAAPLLAVEFGSPLANSELQPGFQGMWGTNDQTTTATLGDYSVALSANNAQPPGSAATSRGFFTKLPGNGGRIDSVDASIRHF